MSTQRAGSRRRRILIWTGGCLLVVFAALAVVLSISDWNFARKTVSSMIGSKLNREVRIDGDLTAHLFSRAPSVRLNNIVVGSPDWVGDHDFAAIDRIDLAINLRELLTGDLLFETLTIEKPNVALISDNEGRSNFNFTTGDGGVAPKDKARKAPDLPGVKHFTVRGGELYVRDEVHKLTFEGKVEANENSDNVDAEPFKLRGEGTLNDEPFGLLFKGGPLANVRVDEPYEFTTDVTAGKTIGAIKGTFERPFDLATLTASLDVKGENLAHLYYLTNLALPFTPPYRVAADVHTSKQDIFIEKLNGKVGNSDVKGKLTVSLANDKPKLTGELESRSLNLDDLAPAVGKGVHVDAAGDAIDSAAPGALPADKLFPTFVFQFDRLAIMDADVTLHAASVQAKKVPFKEVGFHLQLNNSVLTMDPLVFTLPQGKIAATVEVDARQKTARNKLDVRITNMQLDQFKGKNSNEAPFDGILEARMQISGTGNSVHELAANANGRFTAIVPHGEVRKAFAELLGINVTKGLGLLLAKDESKTTIRCGVATLDIQDGNAAVEQMVFDTDRVLIKGDGKIALEPEKLDLDLSGHPKKFQLVRLRSPVTVSGTLRKPAIGIDAGDAAKQVGIAALIGALFTPLSSALAFIDPGLAKDANCSALLAEAQEAQAKNVKPVQSAWQTQLTREDSRSGKRF